MKLVIFASNSKATNIGLKWLISKRKAEIGAIIIVEQLKGGLFRKLKSFFKYLKRTSLIFIAYKIYDGMGSKDIIRIAKENKIPLIKTRDVNEKMVISVLESVKPDLSISYFTQQIFKEPLISLPKLGTINIHGSLLPKYKGAAQYFWYLHNNDKKGGITVHYVDENLDTGDIMLQSSFDIKNETMKSLHIKIGEEGARLAQKALDLMENKKFVRKPQGKSESGSLTLPTGKDMKEFRKMGLKVF